MKVKELTVNPGCCLSMQRHAHRAEYWVVSEGVAQVEKDQVLTLLNPHHSISIQLGEWHQLSNPYGTPVKIVEIQYGDRCDETDIERQ
jgi:mannose-6-phosphate isomerase-like protein (cupin superfamily)